MTFLKTFKRTCELSSRWFFTVLRFLNVLEPRRHILSVSKLFMWVSLIATVYVLVETPDNLAAVMAAAGSNITATANYAYRRKMQYDVGELAKQYNQSDEL